MKKISIIVMALVFLVALTQCKKEQATPANDGKTVDITLDIKSGNGTRMDVNTSTGEVTYVSGDKIYVASGGKYVGTLTHNGTRFSGAISDPTVGEPLHFYFLGNVTPAETLTAGTTTTCSVVISDQTEHLPVIEYAPSNENYTAGATTFTAHLLNKCALVKFNVSTLSSSVVYIRGMNNKVVVDLETNSFSYEKFGAGIIKLGYGNGEKWAILLPQTALGDGELGSAYSEDGEYTGTRGAVPAIYENGYLTGGISVVVSTEVNPGDIPVGIVNGKFTINSNGNQVYFSQGNLQYQASTNTWRFAENQWDYVGTQRPGYGDAGGTVDGSDNSNISPTYSGWIDLFGWGTSGYHDPSDPYNVNYQPWSTSTSTVNTDYNFDGYGPSINMASTDLTGNSADYDWGVYNPISNGGNIANQWRVLTRQEWRYVFSTRRTTSGIRYAMAQVNNVNGVILLPDNWNANYYSLNNTNSNNAFFDSNILTASQWNTLEQAGAVFLPAAGQRYRTELQRVNSLGNYWSSTHYFEMHAYYVFFDNGSFGSNMNTYDSRCGGRSVRLVRSAY